MLENKLELLTGGGCSSWDRRGRLKPRDSSSAGESKWSSAEKEAASCGLYATCKTQQMRDGSALTTRAVH